MKKLAIVAAFAVVLLAVYGSWAAASSFIGTSAGKCSTSLQQSSLKCLKAELVKTQRALTDLQRDVLKCEKTINVAQFGVDQGTYGYVWRDPTATPTEFLTSALDISTAQDADWRVLVYTC
jgi:hypothetical protein